MSIPQEWTKSSVSGNDNGCVEARQLTPDGAIEIRDSKLGESSPILKFTPHEWACFVAGIHNGELQ